VGKEEAKLGRQGEGGDCLLQRILGLADVAEQTEGNGSLLIGSINSPVYGA
jgi:hypothetical protein